MIESVHSERILEQHVSVIYRTCRRHTPNDEAAWDACQETFLAFSRRRDSLDLTEDLSPWLRETARRCSLAVGRKERREETNSDQLDGQATEIDYVDAAFLREAKSILREEAAKMSADDQKLLRMVYVDCITHRAAAEQLGCPAGSVHAKAEQARDRLRRRLERRGIAMGLLLFLFLLNGETEAAWNPVRKYPQPTGNRFRQLRKTALLSSLLLFMLYLCTSNEVLSDSFAQIIGAVYQPAAESCGCDERAEGDESVKEATKEAIAVTNASQADRPNG